MLKKLIGIILAVTLSAGIAIPPASANQDAHIIKTIDNLKFHKPKEQNALPSVANVSYSGNSAKLSITTNSEDGYEEIAGFYPSLSEEDTKNVKFAHFSFEQTIAASDTSIKIDFCGETDTAAFEMLDIGGKLAIKLANAYPDIAKTSADFTAKTKIDWIFEQTTYPVDRAYQYIYVNNELVSEGISEGKDASTPTDIVVKAKSTNSAGTAAIVWDNFSLTLYSSDMSLENFTGNFAKKRGETSCWVDSGAKSEASSGSFTICGKAMSVNDSAVSSPCAVALFDSDGTLLDVDIKKCNSDGSVETKEFQKSYDGKTPVTARMLICDSKNGSFSENSLAIPKGFDSTPIYILAIGNSFAMDALSKLKNIAKADGVNIEPYTANHSGRPLTGHFESLTEDKVDYQIRPGGSNMTDNKVTMKDFLKMYDWDYVTMQGTTHYSAYDEGLFGENSEKIWQTLTDAVAKNAPNAKRLVHATWTPINELSGRINDGMFEDGTPDHAGAYLAELIERNKLGANIYSTETGNDGKKVFIPTLVAVDYLVRHYGFTEYGGELDETSTYDNSETTRCVYRDKTCHLTDNVGRVLAGLVWYEMLTGTPATETSYKRSTLSDEDMQKIKEAAHYACENYMTYSAANVK